MANRNILVIGLGLEIECLIILDYNDLWVYHTILKQWRCLKNHSSDSVTVPSPRAFASMVTDKDNTIYIFGGVLLKERCVYKNDMWTLKIVSSNWTFSFEMIAGTYKDNDFGEYDDAIKIPKARAGHGATMFNGLIFIYGGYWDLSERQTHEDVWAFNVKQKTFNLIDGNKVPNKKGTYNGTKQYPGSRSDFRLIVFDKIIFLYGGIGFGNDTKLRTLDDIWVYNDSKFEFKGTTNNSLSSYAISLLKSSIIIHGGNNDYSSDMSNMYCHTTNIQDTLSSETWSINSNFEFSSYVNNPKLIDIMYWYNGKDQQGTPGSREHHVLVPVGDKIYLYGGNGIDKNSTVSLSDLWVFSEKYHALPSILTILILSQIILFVMIIIAMFTHKISQRTGMIEVGRVGNVDTHLIQ